MVFDVDVGSCIFNFTKMLLKFFRLVIFGRGVTLCVAACGVKYKTLCFNVDFIT